jgi:hypothetical protein
MVGASIAGPPSAMLSRGPTIPLQSERLKGDADVAREAEAREALRALDPDDDAFLWEDQGKLLDRPLYRSTASGPPVPKTPAAYALTVRPKITPKSAPAMKRTMRSSSVFALPARFVGGSFDRDSRTLRASPNFVHMPNDLLN